jgi:sensor c-di-GMP phosphodiesterase-like protein
MESPTPKTRRRRPSTRTRKTEDCGWILVVADAHLAAATATQMADFAIRLAKRAQIGEDDALEVVQAAARARQAAEQCQEAPTEDESLAAMRLTLAALESAKEADQRLNADIAESLCETERARPRETAKGA